MYEQQESNRARIYGYVIGLAAFIVVIAWRLSAR